MSLEQIITILDKNEEVGKNEAASAVQINIANVKLRRNRRDTRRIWRIAQKI